jgi:hypothetical protein
VRVEYTLIQPGIWCEGILYTLNHKLHVFDQGCEPAYRGKKNKEI